MAERSIQRFGVSIGEKLLEKFDALIEDKGYTNRSEAIRDLIREKLVTSEIEDRETPAGDVIGTVTIVYDHHTHDLADRLNDIAHDHHDLIISSVHVHLSHASCLEVMVVKGHVKTIRRFADAVISSRGVKHGKLVFTSLVEEHSGDE